MIIMHIGVFFIYKNFILIFKNLYASLAYVYSFFYGVACKTTFYVRMSTALRVKQLMRLKQLMGTRYGFARKATNSVRMSTALRVKRLICSKGQMRTRYGFCA